MTIELDREIAENVIGETDLVKGWPIPKYSTDIKDAWSVVEKMRELGFIFSMEACRGNYKQVSKKDKKAVAVIEDNTSFFVLPISILPLICYNIS